MNSIIPELGVSDIYLTTQEEEKQAHNKVVLCLLIKYDKIIVSLMH